MIEEIVETITGAVMFIALLVLLFALVKWGD